jgi:hypothetical protein
VRLRLSLNWNRGPLPAFNACDRFDGEDAMIRALILASAAAALSGAWPQDAKEQDDQIPVQLKLRNGSVIKGKLAPLESFILKTRHGTLQVPLKEVRSVSWGRPAKEERDTIRSATGVFTGWIENEEKFQVDTGYGVLRISPDQVRDLRVVRGTMADRFDDASLDGWKVQGGSWKVENGRLRGTANSNYQSQIHFEEELEGSHVLEVSIKAANNVGVVWNAVSATDLYAVWIQQGTIYVYGGNPWWNAAALNVNWAFPPAPGGEYKVRLEVDGTNATILVNGTRLGAVNTQRDRGRAGLWICSGTAEFDDWKIEP